MFLSALPFLFLLVCTAYRVSINVPFVHFLSLLDTSPCEGMVVLLRQRGYDARSCGVVDAVTCVPSTLGEFYGQRRWVWRASTSLVTMFERDETCAPPLRPGLVGLYGCSLFTRLIRTSKFAEYRPGEGSGVLRSEPSVAGRCDAALRATCYPWCVLGRQAGITPKTVHFPRVVLVVRDAIEVWFLIRGILLEAPLPLERRRFTSR